MSKQGPHAPSATLLFTQTKIDLIFAFTSLFLANPNGWVREFLTLEWAAIALQATLAASAENAGGVDAAT
jgi:hypothetical protein